MAGLIEVEMLISLESTLLILQDGLLTISFDAGHPYVTQRSGNVALPNDFGV